MKINGLAIKKAMAKKQLTSAELAERMGMSRQNLSAVLMRGTCSIINAGRIADALGVPFEEIVKEA